MHVLLLSGCTGPMSSLQRLAQRASPVPGSGGAWRALHLVLIGVVVLWIHAMRPRPGAVSDREAQRVQKPLGGRAGWCYRP